MFQITRQLLLLEWCPITTDSKRHEINGRGGEMLWLITCQTCRCFPLIFRLSDVGFFPCVSHHASSCLLSRLYLISLIFRRVNIALFLNPIHSYVLFCTTKIFLNHLVLFLPQSKYVCIRHYHIYVIDVTMNHQINKSFIKISNQMFSVYDKMGVAPKVKATRPAYWKGEASTYKFIYFIYFYFYYFSFLCH